MLFALTISRFVDTFKPVTIEWLIVHTRGMHAYLRWFEQLL
jgi:hypothetical protein